MTFLFIDDHAPLLYSWRRAFGSNPDVHFSECHSVQDALDAIAEFRPDVIFLDHNLSAKGGDGLEVAERVKDVTIYSTTSDIGWVSVYQDMGIETVDKTDPDQLRAIIDAHSSRET